MPTGRDGPLFPTQRKFYCRGIYNYNISFAIRNNAKVFDLCAVKCAVELSKLYNCEALETKQKKTRRNKRLTFCQIPNFKFTAMNHCHVRTEKKRNCNKEGNDLNTYLMIKLDVDASLCNNI